MFTFTGHCYKYKHWIYTFLDDCFHFNNKQALILSKMLVVEIRNDSAEWNQRVSSTHLLQHISPTQSLTPEDQIHLWMEKWRMCVFLETDRGWSLETQTLLITTCHNSGIGFKSRVSPHQSPWSPAHLASASKICALCLLVWKCLGGCVAIQACRAFTPLLKSSSKFQKTI